MSKPNPMGGTFAERKAAAEGKSSFDAPAVDVPGEVANTTFAERAAAREKAEKQVRSSSTEDKAVASSESKSRSTRKK